MDEGALSVPLTTLRSHSYSRSVLVVGVAIGVATIVDEGEPDVPTLPNSGVSAYTRTVVAIPGFWNGRSCDFFPPHFNVVRPIELLHQINEIEWNQYVVRQFCSSSLPLKSYRHCRGSHQLQMESLLETCDSQILASFHMLVLMQRSVKSLELIKCKMFDVIFAHHSHVFQQPYLGCRTGIRIKVVRLRTLFTYWSNTWGATASEEYDFLRPSSPPSTINSSWVEELRQDSHTSECRWIFHIVCEGPPKLACVGKDCR